MLFAYILTKSRFLRLKIVRDRTKNVFRKKGIEYYIDPDCIYSKRFLWKKVFFSMYFEGLPNPIRFDIKNKNIDIQEVPLNDIAEIMSRILKAIYILIILILSIVNFALLLALAIKVFQ